MKKVKVIASLIRVIGVLIALAFWAVPVYTSVTTGHWSNIWLYLIIWLPASIVWMITEEIADSVEKP